MKQISLFDGTKDFTFDKPIRLIELFAGYGSQALALKYLGVPFERWRISEWAVKSIQAYKDIHAGESAKDFSAGKTAEFIREWLSGRISSDYNTPMTDEQIARLGERRMRKIYNNMAATNNLGSITKIAASDLRIEETESYLYIMTYSFPCQDLSAAGKGKGMKKDSGTRSGLLWEVERLLNECKELPQVLLMENVPQVHGEKNKSSFYEWCAVLENLGYHNYLQDMNAKDYAIPQNRERCFMLSILGDYTFTFPKPMKLRHTLKDYLDKEVDENYYLPEKTVQTFLANNEKQAQKGNGFKFEPTDGGGYAKSLLTKSGGRPCDNFIGELRNSIRGQDTSSAYPLRERLQGLWKPADDGSNITGADGYMIGKSEAFQRGTLKDVSRAILTDGSAGVCEWKK